MSVHSDAAVVDDAAFRAVLQLAAEAMLTVFVGDA